MANGERFAAAVERSDGPFVIVNLRRRRARTNIRADKRPAGNLRGAFPVVGNGSPTVLIARLVVNHAKAQ